MEKKEEVVSIRHADIHGVRYLLEEDVLKLLEKHNIQLKLKQ